LSSSSNIDVSAILFGGKPLTLLKLGRARHVQLFISDDIVDETLGVLREKFNGRTSGSSSPRSSFEPAPTWSPRPSA